MLLRTFTVGISLFFAIFILGFSILRTATPKHAFYQPITTSNQKAFVSQVDYTLPQPGVLPDHPLWPLKVARDKLWSVLTQDPSRKSELSLLFADKRIIMAEQLIYEGDIELGIATATKAEQYLQEAQEYEVEAASSGAETVELAESLAKASLKHREILESATNSVPDDAKPVLIRLTTTPREVYEKSVHRLNEKGKSPPTPTPKVENIEQD